MDGRNLNQLYIISFLDSFCTGVTLPVLNNYIVVGLKGSHFLLGLLGVLQTLCQFLISPLINHAIKFVGARNLLIFSHLITFMNYIIIIMANDYHLFLLFRVPYFFFNQTSYLTDFLIGKTDKKYQDGKFVQKMTSTAFILGPFCGGLLYHDASILCVACLLNILTALSLVMAYKLPEDGNNSKIEYPRPLFNRVWKINWREYWQSKSVLNLLKIMITIGLTCFFIKFTLIMGANLNASASLIGFTIALHNLIFLAVRYSSRLIDDTIRNIHACFRQLLLACILLMTISIYMLCTTRDYGEYLIAFVVLAVTKEMFERLWAIETEINVRQSVESQLKFINCILPIVLGMYCDKYSHKAVQVMSVAPLLLASMYGFWRLGKRSANSKMQTVQDQIKHSFNLINKKFN